MFCLFYVRRKYIQTLTDSHRTPVQCKKGDRFGFKPRTVSAQKEPFPYRAVSAPQQIKHNR